jgi:hypothetical protein
VVDVERDEPSVAVDVGVAPVQVGMNDSVRAADRPEPLDLAGQSLAELAEFGEVRRGPARAGTGRQGGRRPFDEDAFVEVLAVVAGAEGVHRQVHPGDAGAELAPLLGGQRAFVPGRAKSLPEYGIPNLPVSRYRTYRRTCTFPIASMPRLIPFSAWFEASIRNDQGSQIRADPFRHYQWGTTCRSESED